MSKKQAFIPQEQLQMQTSSNVTSIPTELSVVDPVQKLQKAPEVPVLNATDTVAFKNEERLLPVIEANEIPSQFIPYPNGARIAYRPYTFGEVKKFNQSKMSIVGRFEFILDGIECSFDKKLLTLSDFLFLALLRKISSVGNSKFQFTYLCSECGHKNTEVMELNKIDFHDLDIPGCPIIFDIGGRELHFVPMQIGSYLDLLTNNLKEDPVAVFAKQVINMPYEEAYKIIYSASDEEGSLIGEMDKMVFHGIKPVEVMCQNLERVFIEEDEANSTDEFKAGKEVKKPCEHISNIMIDSPEVLVSPFRLSNESVKSRIRFGSKA